MSAQSAEPMGETPRRIRIRDLLTQVLEQFHESQRSVPKIELPDEKLVAFLPVQATVQSIAALVQNAMTQTWTIGRS